MSTESLADKPWYLSRGAVANGIGIGLGVLTTLGVIDIDGEARQALLETGPEVWIGLVTAIINAAGLWGRVKANLRLRLW